MAYFTSLTSEEEDQSDRNLSEESFSNPQSLESVQHELKWLSPLQSPLPSAQWLSSAADYFTQQCPIVVQAASMISLCNAFVAAS